MEMVIVGIDVAKASLDVPVLPAAEAFAVGRDAAGIDALIARLRPADAGCGAPAIVAVEATGGLESSVAASPGAAGLPVVVVDPAQVRAFAQAHGPDHWANGRRRIPSMRQMVRGDNRRGRGGHPAEGQREQRPSARLKKSIQRLRKALQKELAVIDREIDDAVEGSPLWSRTEDLVSSVIGVGPAISRTLMRCPDPWAAGTRHARQPKQSLRTGRRPDRDGYRRARGTAPENRGTNECRPPERHRHRRPKAHPQPMPNLMPSSWR